MNESTAAAAAAAMMEKEKEKEKEKSIEDKLALPILLAERVRKAAGEAGSFKAECTEVGKQVDRLAVMLRCTARFATTAPSLYERPVRRVLDEVSKNLDRALALVRKCKRRSVLLRVVSIIGAADFRKLALLLDASIGDLRWLLSVFDSSDAGGGIELTLPPIASTDPILSWVWSSIASVQMGQQLSERIEGANQLASLAKDNDRNKKIIVEEGGVAPLLKLLKDSNASAEAQIASATALKNLSNDPDRVRVIVIDLGIPLIVQVLNNSPLRVQIQVADLVARMAERDSVAQQDFARENAIRPLVSLLSLETFLDEPSPPKPPFSASSSSVVSASAPGNKPTIHSIVQANKAAMGQNSVMEMPAKPLRHHSHSSSSSSSFNYDGSSRGGHNRREWENEKPEVKLQLKIRCAEALWMLARGSVLNSKRITETKGLLSLAKIIEKEREELQFNCLMTVMEITAAAESNPDLRRAAFRTNSSAAKAVVEQLLRVIKESENPTLQIPAVKSIGSLARTFPARETRVIEPLVTLLSHSNLDVATEAAVALAKFASPENFLCMEHSKAIAEFNCIPPLLRLLRGNEQALLHGLVLLCYLALHAGNNEALEQARVKTALEGADRSVAAHHPELRELLSKALYHLNLYHSGVLPPRLSSYTD